MSSCLRGTVSYWGKSFRAASRSAAPSSWSQRPYLRWWSTMPATLPSRWPRLLTRCPFWLPPVAGAATRCVTPARSTTVSSTVSLAGKACTLRADSVFKTVLLDGSPMLLLVCVSNASPIAVLASGIPTISVSLAMARICS
jgi:hypothetical protein